ncbi:hypothetical protein C0J52_20726 [Blattella germanica]|nr:hypothetical protein C0J52_20726 [Blattella germanica]
MAYGKWIEGDYGFSDNWYSWSLPSRQVVQIKVNDVEDVGSAFIESISDPKTHVEQNFVVSGNFESNDLLSLCCKYSAVLSPITGIDKFFVSYRNGKCSKEVAGINMF